MSKISMKTVCCTCLSTNRKLSQLCRILDGINLLYMLLTHDPEAYKEGFYKDTASLQVCWECCAIMDKIKRFIAQVCGAQKLLTSITDGKNNVKLRTYSRLTETHNSKPQYEFRSYDMLTENFIDCGPIKEIKTENDSDDVPLSVFYYENDSDDSYEPSICTNEPIKETNEPIKYINEPSKATNEPSFDTNRPNKSVTGLNKNVNASSKYANGLNNMFNEDTNRLRKSTNEPSHDNNKFTNDNEHLNNDNSIFGTKLIEPGNFSITSKRKQSKHGNITRKNIHKTKSKLEKCANEFSNKTAKSKTVTKKEITSRKRTKMKYGKYFSIQTMNEEDMRKSIAIRKMDIKNTVFKCHKCLIEFKTKNEQIKHNIDFHEYKEDNYSQCDICHAHTNELLTHRKQHYECYNCMLCVHTAYTQTHIIRHLKRNHRDVCSREKKGLKGKRKGHRLKDFSTYPCPECDNCFQNKDLRWKHIQRAHRDGYKCNTCDKKFAFKNNLERHERIHAGPLPREECQTCHKMIRVDLVKAHSRIHTDRQTHTCVECDKSFVSRATYESHLKYAQAHATVDVCRHKCPTCHKRYRSRGELQDHINYQHKGQAEHKCPICGKGLATKRCIRRHVRRTHEGIKESAKDKICQQCGKAFRDKKGLIEHERVHTGSRPLSCATCGRAFRQRAALYVHTRRLHNVTHTAHSGTHTAHSDTHTARSGTHTAHTGTHTAHTGTHTAHTGTHTAYTATHTADTGTHTAHTEAASLLL